ncbi:MAG: hypothetical protein AMXMBFR84_03730 [Candidatus Hydrogenedentota bacterium]
MPKSEAKRLRIYCICGQKMKVSPGMYGKPGKCVACRQKILIPHPDDLPPDTDVVHLKDHPEYLRKSKAPAVPEPDPEPEPFDDENRDSLMAEDGAVKLSVPLDDLEPLKVLCSLHYRISAAIRDSDRLSKDEHDSLRRNHVKVRAALEDLEEELRQRLMETAIELTSTQEKISELALAVRVGEIELKPYREQIERQRRRRDLLERLQENLRGWLSVDDPYLAGGLIEVPLDAIPAGPFRIPMTLDVDKIHTILDWHVDGLREALEAKQELRNPGPASNGHAGSPAEALQAIKARYNAEAQYRRARLEEYKADLAQDLKAVDAQLDHLRGKIQAAQITREQFDEGERDLTRLKSDLAKARSLVSRALAAKSAAEVPHPRGTFIERLARVGLDTTDPVDRWLLRASAVVLASSVFIPGPGGMSLASVWSSFSDETAYAHLWFIGLLITAAALLPVSFVRPRERRGLVEVMLWLAVMLITGIAWFESRYGHDPVSAWIREAGSVPTQPYQLAYMAGMLGWLVAAFAALAPFPRIRFVPAALASTAAVCLIVAATDVGGLRIPSASLSVGFVPQEEEMRYRVEVSLRNTGGRPLFVNSQSTALNNVTYAVERHAGSDVWLTVPKTGSEPAFTVLPGDSREFEYSLDPGEYRAIVNQPDSGHAMVAYPFTLDPIQALGAVVETVPAPTPTAPPAAAAPTETPPQPASPGGTATGSTGIPRALLELQAAQVEFQGVLNAPQKDPRFIVSISVPGGRSRKEPLPVLSELYDGWIIAEFNPREQSITVSKDDTLLIMRPGDTVFLTKLPQPEK